MTTGPHLLRSRLLMVVLKVVLVVVSVVAFTACGETTAASAVPEPPRRSNSYATTSKLTSLLNVTSLRLNYMESPLLGFDRTIGRFTWQIPQSRTQKQVVARVVVMHKLPSSSSSGCQQGCASNTGGSGGVVAFDSGCVATSQPTLVSSPSAPHPMSLQSDSEYVWWVEVWLQEDKSSSQDATSAAIARVTNATEHNHQDAADFDVSLRGAASCNSHAAKYYQSGDDSTGSDETLTKDNLTEQISKQSHKKNGRFNSNKPISDTAGNRSRRSSGARNSGSNLVYLRSANATFLTGLLSGSTEWRAAGAEWIRGRGSGPKQMRRDFVIPSFTTPGRVLTRATLFIAACQYYEAFLDGKRIGIQRLDSPWTQFYTNRSYTTHNIDVHLLVPGNHTLGLRVGQGFCTSASHDAYDADAERSAIALLQVHATTSASYTNISTTTRTNISTNTRTNISTNTRLDSKAAAIAPPPADSVFLRVATDASWTSGDGPITSDSTYYGETYDARLETPGWAEPGFVPPTGHASWQPVQTNLGIVAELKAQGMEPISAVQEIRALSVQKVVPAIPPAPPTPSPANVGPCALQPENKPAMVTCNGKKAVIGRPLVHGYDVDNRNQAHTHTRGAADLIKTYSAGGSDEQQALSSVSEGKFTPSLDDDDNFITGVQFASFGTPQGGCTTTGGGPHAGTCSSSANLTAAIASACIGSPNCTITCIGRVPPSFPNGRCTITAPGKAVVTFEPGDACQGVSKHLAVVVKCNKPTPPLPPPPPPPPPAAHYVYDFGQEFAGVVRLTLPLGTPAGTRISMKHAEALQHPPLGPADGTVWMGNLFWANPIDVYIAKGTRTNSSDLPEVYTPSFTYHGFRYLELVFEAPPPPPPTSMGTESDDGAVKSAAAVSATAADAVPHQKNEYYYYPEPPSSLPLPAPTLDSAVGLVLRNSVAQAGRLALGSSPKEGAPTGSNLLQRLSNNSLWTEAAALMSIPAGAAGRGERNGWTGDAAFGSESECFDFDTGAFFSRYLEQVTDAQDNHTGEVGGGVPSQGTAPTTRHHSEASPFDPSWSAVFPVVAYNVWKYYNCTTCIDNSYSGLELYRRMLARNYSISPTTFGRWGDWNPAYPHMRSPTGTGGGTFTLTVSSITAAAMVVQNFDEAAEMAAATGRTADAARYAGMLPTLRHQYHAAFYDEVGGVYGDGTPTAFATALWLDAVPASLLPGVVDRLVWRLADFNYTMTGVGFIGVRYLFEALAKVNRTDVALRMLAQRQYPSFGYQITNSMEPATTLWESYDVPTMHQWVDESSRDHHYSASINTFLRKYLGGLDQPRGSAAWGVVKCRPEAARFPDLLDTAAASLNSHRGPVACMWRVLKVPPSHLLPPPPPPPPSTPPPILCAVTPMFTGALRKDSPMHLRCPAGHNISVISMARWGLSAPNQPWFCWGYPQPSPRGVCETDVSSKIAPLCLGKGDCDLSLVANPQKLGSKCSGSQQLIVRVQCGKAGTSSSSDLKGLNSKGEVVGAADYLGVEAQHQPQAERRSGGPVSEHEEQHALRVDPPRQWVEVNISVPGGSTGEVHVPLLDNGVGTITESGMTVWRNGSFVPSAAAGVRGGGTDGKFAWFMTQSGNYSFSAFITPVR